MLTIYDPSNPTTGIPFPVKDDKRYVTHAYNGLDTLTFEIQSDDPLYEYVAEEGKVADEHNRFVIKCIDEHSDFVTVVCDIDLDDWKQDIIYEFRTTNKLLTEVISMILPEGWKAIGADTFYKRTTVEGLEGSPLKAVTPLEVLIEAADAYSCVFNFDAINKTVTAIDPKSFQPSGQFFTDELNLKSLGFVGSSDGFATRLYAYGKKDANGNPTTFADVNGGKPYVEDYSYSTKVISVGWSDERYTNPESLLAAAKLRLAQISHPSRSYECDAKNLNEDVWLYKVVTLVDRRRKTRVNHQVVEFREYPDHTLDVITLSKTAPNLKAFVTQVQSAAQDTVEKETAKTKNVLEEAIKHATAQITGNNGGAFVWILDADGKPVELLNLCDSTDLNTAKSVWRWNASGLGHSSTGYDGAMTLALLPDGSINASAITAGILNADLLRTGTIRSIDGTIEIDLLSGNFVVHVPDSTGLDRQFRFTKTGIWGSGEHSETGEMVDSLCIMPAVFGNKGVSENGFNSFNGADLVLTASATAKADGTIVPPGRVIIGSGAILYAPDVLIKGKTVSWKDNGDGTSTLIGK